MIKLSRDEDQDFKLNRITEQLLIRKLENKRIDSHSITNNYKLLMDIINEKQRNLGAHECTLCTKKYV